MSSLSVFQHFGFWIIFLFLKYFLYEINDPKSQTLVNKICEGQEKTIKLVFVQHRDNKRAKLALFAY